MRLPPTPQFLRKPATLWTLSISFSVVIVVSIVMLVTALIPTSKPDLWADDVADVANFMLDEDFNRLPPRDRLTYLVDFLKRLRDLDQDDLALLAEMGADVSRKVRQQIEENARRLIVDFLSDEASKYALLSPEEQADFIESFVIEMDRMGESLEDNPRNLSDEERLQNLRAQARRDRDRAQETSSTLTGERVSGFFRFYNDEAAASAGAVQRGQIARLMRDMTRHLRGDDGGPNR